MSETEYSQKDVIDLLVKFKEEDKKTIEQVTKGLATLQDAVDSVKESKKKWWSEYRVVIVILITLLAMLIFIVGVTFSMKFTNFCIATVGENGESVHIKSCESK